MRNRSACSAGPPPSWQPDNIDLLALPEVEIRRPVDTHKRQQTAERWPLASIPETPTENRKVGGSTPPLATTKTAGHRPVTCLFVLLSDWRPLS